MDALQTRGVRLLNTGLAAVPTSVELNVRMDRVSGIEKGTLRNILTFPNVKVPSQHRTGDQPSRLRKEKGDGCSLRMQSWSNSNSIHCLIFDA